MSHKNRSLFYINILVSFLFWSLSSGFDNGTLIKTEDGEQIFRIESTLGHGDFGTVYKVQPTTVSNSSTMALKVFDQSLPEMWRNIGRRGYELYVSVCQGGCGPALHNVSIASEFRSVSDPAARPFFGVLSELAIGVTPFL
ncbi:MAG: hypothetical protein IOD12_03795 [Silvanigrellales bacterium]|nr:hypothetical protein [Silvanigrellales bacterium]